MKFDAFMPVEVCAPTAAAAMGFVAHVAALIIDLRDNGGGDPAMVSFVASYLFGEPTHLNDLYSRYNSATKQYWTASYLPGERLVTQPVFVLTSSHTFSGAEEFSYDIQTQKRGKIIGEPTGGGAHPVDSHMVADYFELGVPYARPINPITKTDWEGTGIDPDVKVTAIESV